tara:strand:- start:1 stop:300 length:300 start_codon:yes stop_codon:yes gene_type:complete
VARKNIEPSGYLHLADLTDYAIRVDGLLSGKKGRSYVSEPRVEERDQISSTIRKDHSPASAISIAGRKFVRKTYSKESVPEAFGVCPAPIPGGTVMANG